ncbi:MAG: signal recognition particle-docking protein FtsY [Deltaproteobacteria bacterium]|nr:signal recognition particle-docking protein FtsY [Deltaproteobacteria bacterium]
MVLISVFILLFVGRKPEKKQEEIELQDVSQIQSAQLETFPQSGEETAEDGESSIEEITDELIEKESAETFELDEPEELVDEQIEEIEDEIRTKTDGTDFEEQEKIEEEVEEETKEGLFSRLRVGLSRTQAGLIARLDDMLAIRKEIDANLWDDFEETLIMADIGVGTTMKLRQEIEGKLTKKSLRDPTAIKSTLREEILKTLKKAEGSPIVLNVKPFVLMVAGVNGVGKTTTIGKLAYRFRKEGKSVMVAAADTFRAAAVEQLEIWAKRVGSDFLKGQSGVDPSAVAFDAVKASLGRGTDVLIIDTAGRLHTKTNLMDELKKVRRVIGRELEGAPHETLLVLDATTGQNAIQQAKMFKEAIDVTGIALTKLDGTAKGGVIVAIADELNIPVKFIGIGESLGDLREFKAEEFVEALFLSGKETLH